MWIRYWVVWGARECRQMCWGEERAGGIEERHYVLTSYVKSTVHPAYICKDMRRMITKY